MYQHFNSKSYYKSTFKLKYHIQTTTDLLPWTIILQSLGLCQKVADDFSNLVASFINYSQSDVPFMIRYSEQIPLAGLTEHSKRVDNKIFSETNYGKEHIKIKCHKL